MPNDIDANDWLLSAGVNSAKFAKIGDQVVGLIARPPEIQHQRDPKTGAAKYWDDGRPQLQMKVILQTEERDLEDAEDNGERAVYIRGQMQKAVSIAVRSAHATGLEVGGKLLVKYIGDGQASTRGFNAPKQYEAKYRAPEHKPEPVPVPEDGHGQVAPIEDSIPF